jgi:excinuclease ABC subunit A
LSRSLIELRGVAVHNLQQIDLDLPRRKLIGICGVSGSGKTSLALDTLYAEGQRRYIDSFSPYTRQFLERPEKPEAERIDGLPPAIAVTRRSASQSPRSTIGTATEINDYLRLLFARTGELYCPSCGQRVFRDTPQSIVGLVRALPAGTRFQIAFERAWEPTTVTELQEQGFVRAVWQQQTTPLADITDRPTQISASPLLVIIDRLAAGGEEQRLRDSLETAFRFGQGRCLLLLESDDGLARPPLREEVVDARTWRTFGFTNTWRCLRCERDFPPVEPQNFSFNSPLGACPRCEGAGTIVDWDLDLILPNPKKSIRQGAIAPWNEPAYAHELADLLARAEDCGLNVDAPIAELAPTQREQLLEGISACGFAGLRGFFASLEAVKQKAGTKQFLSRWKSERPCPACRGTRLNPEALAWRIGGQTIADITLSQINSAAAFFESQISRSEIAAPSSADVVGRAILPQIRSRLAYLQRVGLGYLTLDRPLSTLSGGEAQRVALTSALGSNLVNMLYVLDEPSVGLHPRDVGRLVTAVTSLRDRGNSVVVVEHEEHLLKAADQLVEIGPGAGDRGGRVVFQGTLDEMLASQSSVTADFLLGRRGLAPTSHRPTSRGWMKLSGARGHNLKNITVRFPLGVLCVVTGVSGAGKSSLVQETLYGALCRRKRKECDKPLPYDDIVGDGQIDDVILVNQEPIGRSPRSNPVTYIKAFDPIRQVFSETVEARTRNFGPGHFSFNVDGGRCTHCQGEGAVQIDMQFLADVYMKCPQCQGTRYRKEILAVTYRGKNIAEVLEMTVREAFNFFRGQPKVQARLKQIMDVGLDYLRLGQGANTLSAGEAQRLKLAGYLAEATRNRTLFILDEPTTGLHFADIVQLLDCFDALLNVGHSLIVVEHNLQLVRAADHIIDLGPEAGDGGGTIVVEGTPEEVAACARSHTGQFLRHASAPLAESAESA